MAIPASARLFQSDTAAPPAASRQDSASDVQPSADRGRTMAEPSEAATAWLLFRFNWLLLAGAGSALALCLVLTNFRLQPTGYLLVTAVAAVYGVFGYYNATSQQRSKPWVFSMLTALAQMLLVIPVMLTMTYIATSANLPLRDAALLALDRAIGFDFRSVLDFVDDRDWLIRVLAMGYRAIAWPIWVSVVALPLAGYYCRTGEFVCAFLLALMATTCITALVPAIGAYGAMGLVAADFPHIEPQGYYDTLRDAPLLRDGSMRTLDLFQLAGVVTFPSFHAAAAALYAWALWPLRLFRPFNVLCNGAIIAATPIGGGHFLVDVIAGIAVAAASIYAARRIATALAAAPESGIRSLRPEAVTVDGIAGLLPPRS